jgi:glycosyltransferase involved in cell wall biosynthesis
MTRLRVLVLAPSCNPNGISIPYVGYCHAAALAELHDVTLVIGSPVENNVREANGPFRSIEVVRMPALERLYAWVLRRIFKFNFTSQALTAFSYPFSLAFEWYAWRKLRRRISGGEFDVVLRLLPVSAVMPSPFAFFLRKSSVPFVIGPINGGLPYVSGFSQAARERQWISGLRGLYRFLPFARSTYKSASAIIAASSHTYEEFARYADKLVFLPENGISNSVCSADSLHRSAGKKLELIFVGGLIPCKGCDLALKAAAPLFKSGSASLNVFGDGPERKRLEDLALSLGIEKSVCFHGWVSHDEVLKRLRSADVLVFPSVRDFGGGVVFEALACGAVPVVADFGGPGDIVNPEVGYKVPVTNEGEFVVHLERVLAELAKDRDRLERLRRQGIAYARQRLTWEGKARDTTKVLNWVLKRSPKPDLLPPSRANNHCKFVVQTSIVPGNRQSRCESDVYSSS